MNDESTSRRASIHQATSSSTSLYGGSVNMVNRMLTGRANISQRMSDSIIHNVGQVDRGEMSQFTASFSEAWGFGREALRSVSRRQYRDASFYAFGSAVNMFASGLHFGNNDVANLSRTRARAYHGFNNFPI